MEIAGEPPYELQVIQNKLHLAMRDHKALNALVESDPENAYAKEEMVRLRLLIGTLAQNQSLILREIRRKVSETANAEPVAQVEPANVANENSMSSKEKENEIQPESKTTNQPVKDGLDDQMENQEPELGKCLNSAPPLGERPIHEDNMLPNNSSSNTKLSLASASTNTKPEPKKPEAKTINQPVEDSLDKEMENQEPEWGKCLISVTPLGQRLTQEDNTKPTSASALTNIKPEPKKNETKTANQPLKDGLDKHIEYQEPEWEKCLNSGQRLIHEDSMLPNNSPSNTKPSAESAAMKIKTEPRKTDTKTTHQPVENGSDQQIENQERERWKCLNSAPSGQRSLHEDNMLPNTSTSNTKPSLASPLTNLKLEPKELETKTINQPVEDCSDEQVENQERERWKCLSSVSPLGERPMHEDNMLPNNSTSNTKLSLGSASTNIKIESENDASGAIGFLEALELMPTCNLQHELRTTERKRATRQKRSTANHSQFVYDDSWDQDDKKKRKKEKEVIPLKVTKSVPVNVKSILAVEKQVSVIAKPTQVMKRKQVIVKLVPAKLTSVVKSDPDLEPTPVIVKTEPGLDPVQVNLKPTQSPVTAELAETDVRTSNQKREVLLARRQLGELVKKNSASKPTIPAIYGNGVFYQRKNGAPLILAAKPKSQKLILPKPCEPGLKADKKVTVELVSNNGPMNQVDNIPTKKRKVSIDPKRKSPPQKMPTDFPLEDMPRPGWNTTIEISQPRDKPTFASSINSLIQSAQAPPGLSLKIPGLPASLTIERISEQQRVCCMCRKPALITGLFGEKISDALTSCHDCGMTYHLSCTRSTSTSNEYHVCPHCFKKQSTHDEEDGGKDTRCSLLLEKIRLVSERESLDKKLRELGTDVTCTITSGAKPQN